MANPIRHLAFPMLATFLVTACPEHSTAASSIKPVQMPVTGSALEPHVQGFDRDLGSIRRYYELRWSEAQAGREEKAYGAWEEKLNALDFGKLDQQARIDWLLLRNEIAQRRTRDEREKNELREMAELLPVREPIQKLELERIAMQSVDPGRAAGVVSGFPETLRDLRKRLEQGKKKDEKGTNDVTALKPPAVVALRAANAANDFRSVLKRWFSFYDGYQPDFSWWLRKPVDDAATALEEYAKFLREEIAGIKGKDEDPLLGEAIGSNALAQAISQEMLAYSARELIEIGEREFAWCENEMKRAAGEMGFTDWKKALAKVKEQFVPPGGQDEWVKKVAQEAISFVKEKDLVSVPPLCEETWRLTMLNPSAQKTIPYVAYSDQNILVAYAKDEMKHEDKVMSMRGNNRHFTRITTAHELIPGHHLQAFQASRNRPYRQIFSTPFLVEGWALYWELRLWDLGYAQTPEDRMGMLFWRMHRCARIIVSLKFHLGEITPTEMVTFLVDRVGHEKLGATSEVRRFIGGGYSPLYQAGYMIGGMQLNGLRREIVEAGRMTERQFNDALLSYGPIPVEMIRAGLLNQPLTKEFRARWKFAEPTK